MAIESSAAALADRVLAGDLRALARAASWVESRSASGRDLLRLLFPGTGRAKIIGITGPPGAGKSTLVDQLTRSFRRRGETVGIVAVDPTSPYSRGAILGDRIRMLDHHDDPGVFVRSMATRGRLGGVAQATLDVALLLDAAGRDVVIIETVGVGQDEVEIAELADLTLVVLVPGFGDDVQAIKAGMMEIADIFVVNKSDLPGADRLEQEIRTMQSFGGAEERATAAPVRRVAAAAGEGVEELMATLDKAFVGLRQRRSRIDTWALRLREMLREALLESLPDATLELWAQRVAERLDDPYTAIDALRRQLVGDAQT